MANVGGKGFEKDSKVSYFRAKYFHNDLDNEDDYYLAVRVDGENTFVKKEEINKTISPPISGDTVH